MNTQQRQTITQDMYRQVCTQLRTREEEMFGESIESMREGAHFTDLNDPYDLIRYSTAILSDAQYMMALGNTEQARQFTNKAKYFMDEAMEILRTRK